MRGNYLSQLNTSFGCNAIYMTNVQGGLIEQNVTNGAGTSAIELYYTDGITVQHNETFGTKVKAGGADSNGMDTDKATTKTVIQYNYFHDNGDGILLCQFNFGDSVIRYNIIQNNSRYQIYLHSDAAASSAIYNNTVYNNKTNSGVAYGYGTSLDATYTLENNIFYAASGNGVLTTSGTITYQNNLYFGSTIQVPAGDTHPLKADPKLVSPGTGSSGSASGPAFSSLGGYKLAVRLARHQRRGQHRQQRRHGFLGHHALRRRGRRGRATKRPDETRSSYGEGRRTGKSAAAIVAAGTPKRAASARNTTTPIRPPGGERTARSKSSSLSPDSPRARRSRAAKARRIRSW